MIFLSLSFAALLLLGMPIFIAMAGAAIAVIATGDFSLGIVAQRISAGVQSFPLLAVLLFTLAGALMNESGISDRLFALTRAFVGHIRGGLAQSVVISNVFLAGISGSSVADCAASSRIFVPQLTKAGCGQGFAAALCASSSSLGPIIPPSILMVIYAWQANTSLGDLFWAGVIPGLLIASSLMVVVALVAARRNFPKDGGLSRARLWVAFKDAFWALMMPVLILGGFRAGLFTATEIAGVAAAYAFIIGVFVYRSLSFRMLPKVLRTTAMETAVILAIVAAASPFSWILAVEQAPQLLVETIKQVTASPWALLLMLNLALLLLGMIMESIAIMIILVPILLPVLATFGIDLTHFGIVLLINLVIGQLTPPVGVLLFVAGSVSRTKVSDIVREMRPFYVALIAALALVTYVPALSLWLPGLLHG
ncbi:TRAP transporter large permease [Denitromonas ohlonensis]|uniref:TRAP transporter large permease protein n=2 Tax=Denitromonas TaxID=139331 RepID=A0A557RNZ1_9RHOO|nr:TRAP transporter large permease [Denitromonas ohlonensis]TVO66897.1 TRAP transporter large permease [Denitromonas ohlonensis]TVO79767.1 TRAP transporter large permease [Denitromonas ohlonensis]